MCLHGDWLLSNFSRPLSCCGRGITMIDGKLVDAGSIYLYARNSFDYENYMSKNWKLIQLHTQCWTKGCGYLIDYNCTANNWSNHYIWIIISATNMLWNHFIKPAYASSYWLILIHYWLTSAGRYHAVGVALQWLMVNR